MTSAGDGPAGASGGDGSAGASGGDGTAVAGDERTAGAHGDGRVGVVVAAGARRRRWVRAAVWLVVGVCAWVAVTRLVGAVDWSAVADAFEGLPVLVVVPLVLALLLRQTLNAVPLTYYVPGLALRRSMQNDLTANVVATFTPPPSDIVVRVAMFRSWGVDPTAGMAGVTLNTAKFYAVRFLAPTLGLLLLVWGGVDRRQWVVAVVCGLVAAVMLTALVLLLRGPPGGVVRAHGGAAGRPGAAREGGGPRRVGRDDGRGARGRRRACGGACCRRWWRSWAWCSRTGSCCSSRCARAA